MKTFLKVSLVLFLCASPGLADIAWGAGNEKIADRSRDCWYDPDYDEVHCTLSYKCEDCSMLFELWDDRLFTSWDTKEVCCPLCGSRRVVEYPQ